MNHLFINPALLLPQVTAERDVARELATNLEALLCLVLIAVGGEVRIPVEELETSRSLVWRKWVDEAADCVVIEAKVKEDVQSWSEQEGAR